MIAEIYHKVSDAAGSRAERSEDELTGNFFGTMRYLPFTRGLQRIFLKYAKSNDPGFRQALEKIHSEDFHMEFWKRSDLGYGEIDGFLEVEDVSLGIEVKYNSGLSGENQLEREADMMKEWCQREETSKLLLFVAREEGARRTYLANYKKAAFSGDSDETVHLGYLTWEDVLLGLEEVQAETVFEERMVSDLRDLLTEKGFVSFGGFHTDIKVERNLYYDFG